MKIIFNKIFLVLGIILLISGCNEEEFKLGEAPTQEDAAFTYKPSEENDNIILFNSPSNGFMKNWSFGNGSTGKGDNVKGTYPTKGTYTVTLTVFSEGGSVSSSQQIEIAETDPTLLDIPVYNFLTGGADALEGKTWVMDKDRDGHFGVGPADGDWPEWYSAKANEKADRGLYNDEITFKLDGFALSIDTKGDVYVNGAFASDLPGAVPEPAGDDFIAPYTAPNNMTWSLVEVDEDKWQLNITGGGFIGYYSGGATTYEVMNLAENELYIRSVHKGDPGLVWYQRFIPKGYTPPVEEPVEPEEPETSSLPINFEGTEPPFNGFEGSSYELADNPNVSGINTSAKAGKSIKNAGAQPWAGIETVLDKDLDFSLNNLIKMKVYAPKTGTVRFKIENKDDTNMNIEVDANVTKVGEWEELTFDFSAANPANTYNKIALFFDFMVADESTFYFDDIKQTAEMATLTEADLTGGSSKTWKLRPAAGSFGVGQGKGMDNYWPQGADISGDRPCLFNDEFIFKSGGVYEYDSKGDVFGEGYLGVTPDGCVDESALGADAAAWGSGTHSFTFTPATEADPAYITVVGTGAFIALPKAYNGGEYSAGPPAADGSVQYEVYGYTKNGTNEAIFLTVDVSGTGETYWSYVLIAE